MKINSSSELMKNHKHAVVMAPDQQFKVLQTNEGQALFFSIGSDNAFYCTREVQKDKSGWSRIDLSSPLSANYNNAEVSAKTFDIAQNLDQGTTDIALVITVNGSDYLYTALNVGNADADWAANTVQFTAVPYDDTVHGFSGLSIADVYIGQSGSSEFIAADIIANPVTRVIYRYFVDVAGKATGPVWKAHDISTDLEAGKIVNLMGRKNGQLCDGIYTMGAVGAETEVIYTPLYNPFAKKGSVYTVPSATRFNLPEGTTAIAVSLNSDGYTDMFFAAGSTLYYLAYDQQTDGAQPAQIYTHDHLSGLSSLHVDNDGTNVLVWGLNDANQVINLRCAAGNESDSASWSFPVPILEGAQGLASYIHYVLGHSVIFAHMQDDSLIQLTQDAAAATWQQRNILLPGTTDDDVLEYNSFTTHINVVNDDGRVSGSPVALSITSSSPASIYVDDLYYKLSPHTATVINTDATGVLTIVQETQGLSAVCYHVLNKDTGASLDINPMAKMMDIIAKVQSGSDLDAVQLDNGDGTQKPLLPAGTSQDQKDSTAYALKQFVTMASSLPSDGSKKPAQPTTASPAAAVATPAAAATPSATGVIWGMSFDKSGWTYHEGAQTQLLMSRAGLSAAIPMALGASNPSLLDDPGDTILLYAEDGYNWLKTKWDEVTDFFVDLAEDGYHLLVKLEGKIYKFLIDCASAVVNALEFVFNQIKVFFEDLIKYLGFLFNWGDIVRTHKVLKNVLKLYALNAVANIETTKTQIQNCFNDLDNNINNWAGVPQYDQNMGDYTAPDGSDAHQTAQSQWGVHHVKSNSSGLTTSYDKPYDQAEDLIDDLLDLVQAEGQVITGVYDKIKDLADNFSSLTAAEVIQRVIDILAVAMIDTAKDIVIAIVNLFETLLEGFMDILDAPISIPVISWVYRRETGDDLSILDLICLVSAIPTNVIYKLINNDSPFPEDAVTNAFINAQSFSEVQDILANGGPVAPSLAAFSLEALGNGSEGGALVAAQPAAVSLQSVNISDTDPLYQKFVTMANTSACFASIVLCFVNGVKKYNRNTGIVSFLGAVCYLPYVAPDIMGLMPKKDQKDWVQIFNETITDICVLKAMVDVCCYKCTPGDTEGFNAKDPKKLTGFVDKYSYYLSPALDCALNIYWQVPTTAALFVDGEDKKVAGWVNFGGGTAFDIGGWISPIVNIPPPHDDNEELASDIAFGASVFLNLVYAGCCMAQNFIPADKAS
ncbi:hypothetical protein GS399_04925 [Pedobacter sp. HMF7647]|uniref:Uncharacterized protein n=1 Tax=Hufsiella arboris TaxID=2695275 RepID=A0A7K1Y6V4_9SPHI|nr:hypothetical protein [Hufsiella arboris]MXV50306.1 hypothetical protein [Hufsiella arboris]